MIFQGSMAYFSAENPSKVDEMVLDTKLEPNNLFDPSDKGKRILVEAPRKSSILLEKFSLAGKNPASSRLPTRFSSPRELLTSSIPIDLGITKTQESETNPSREKHEDILIQKESFKVHRSMD